MYTGKTLFAQLMDFLPWSTFARLVVRYDGDRRVRTLTCAEQYRAMAFAQLTYRESLRDIETCLAAQSAKLYHMGFREPVRRATLADANEARDWRIHADLAQRLIAQARRLYVGDSLGLDLDKTVYALDSTTIENEWSTSPGSLPAYTVTRLIASTSNVRTSGPASSRRNVTVAVAAVVPGLASSR